RSRDRFHARGARRRGRPRKRSPARSRRRGPASPAPGPRTRPGEPAPPDPSAPARARSGQPVRRTPWRARRRGRTRQPAYSIAKAACGGRAILLASPAPPAVAGGFMKFAAAALIATLSLSAHAKDTVKIAFIGPLTGGNSAIGLGGRNSADLAVRLRNADPKARYQYELVVLDDECKPDAGVQMATKAGSDKGIVGGVTHYCSVVAM